MPKTAARMSDISPIEVTEAPPAKQYLTRGTLPYRRASLALFLSGFSTFSLLYCVQPLLPVFASDYAVSPAEESVGVHTEDRRRDRMVGVRDAAQTLAIHRRKSTRGA